MVLSRKVGESICIDDAIEVMVVAVGSRHVRLGINAPAEIGIRRAELPARTSLEQQASKGTQVLAAEATRGCEAA